MLPASRRFATGLVLLLALIACGRDAPTAPMCAEPLTVSVGTGLQPRITWTPACRAATITVSSNNVELIAPPIWQLTALRGIAPPIRVGAHPAGSLTWGSGATLTAGEAYTVYVSGSVVREEAVGASGSLSFVAQP